MSSIAEKTKQAVQGFRDVLHDLSSGEPLTFEEAEETNDDSPEAGAPEEESSPAKDKESGESAEEAEDEATADDGDTDESETETDESGEDEGGADDEDNADASDDEDGSQTVEIDGEKVTLEQVREWKKDGLRQSDYTKKTQETARQREALEARETLLADIVTDEAMREFVKAHPGILPRLLADAENTRALLGNAEEIQALWDDYELIADNPRLAERFRSGGEDTEEVLATQREAENIKAIAAHLDTQVGEIAKEYEGVDADEVRNYVLQLGRVPVGDNVDAEEVRAGFTRLFSLLFVQDQSTGNYDLDDTLIRNRFQQLKSSASTAATTKDKEADEHNRQVDEKLKDQAPPASKGKGDAPAPEADKIEEKSFRGIMHDLLGYGDE